MSKTPLLLMAVLVIMGLAIYVRYNGFENLQSSESYYVLEASRDFADGKVVTDGEWGLPFILGKTGLVNRLAVFPLISAAVSSLFVFAVGFRLWGILPGFASGAFYAVLFAEARVNYMAHVDKEALLGPTMALALLLLVFVLDRKTFREKIIFALPLLFLYWIGLHTSDLHKLPLISFGVAVFFGLLLGPWARGVLGGYQKPLAVFAAVALFLGVVLFAPSGDMRVAEWSGLHVNNFQEYLGLLVWLAPIGAVLLLVTRASFAGLFLASWLGFALLGSMSRLIIIYTAAIPAALLAASLFYTLPLLLEKKLGHLRGVALAILVLVSLYAVHGNYVVTREFTSTPRWSSFVWPALGSWLASNTPVDSLVLSTIPDSYPIMAYGRDVILSTGHCPSTDCQLFDEIMRTTIGFPSQFHEFIDRLNPDGRPAFLVLCHPWTYPKDTLGWFLLEEPRPEYERVGFKPLVVLGVPPGSQELYGWRHSCTVYQLAPGYEMDSAATKWRPLW